MQRRVARDWDIYLTHPVRWFGKHLAWLPLIVVTFVGHLRHPPRRVRADRRDLRALTPGDASSSTKAVKIVLFSALWLCIIFGLESFARWQRERERLLTLQKHLAESQLAQLKAQLQPHFLFNALNTISSLMHVDVDRADRLLTKLADLLRSSLQAGAQHMTSLRDELETAAAVCDIMQERFAGRVTLDWSIEDDALDAAVPACCCSRCSKTRSSTASNARRRPSRSTCRAPRGRGSRDRPQHWQRSRRAAAPGSGLRNCRERLGCCMAADATLDARAGRWRRLSRTSRCPSSGAPRDARPDRRRRGAGARQAATLVGGTRRHRNRRRSGRRPGGGRRARDARARRRVPRHPDAGALGPRGGFAARARHGAAHRVRHRLRRTRDQGLRAECRRLSIEALRQGPAAQDARAAARACRPKPRGGAIRRADGARAPRIERAPARAARRDAGAHRGPQDPLAGGGRQLRARPHGRREVSAAADVERSARAARRAALRAHPQVRGREPRRNRRRCRRCSRATTR